MFLIQSTVTAVIHELLSYFFTSRTLSYYSLKIMMSASKGATKTPDCSGRRAHMMEQLRQLRSSVQCPVCLEVPRKGPIFICPNGHSVCRKCKRGQCPTCRAAMESTRNRVAEMAIAVIDHECSHDGCVEEFPLSELEKHEEECPYKPIQCIACSKSVTQT